MKIVKWIVAAAAASLLAGCAGQPEIPFDKSANANVRTIGIVTPNLPDRPRVWLASSMGQSFGLIGALVDVSMEENRNDKLSAMLRSHGVDPKERFEKSLEASLRAQGYEVKPVTVTRKQGEPLKAFPSTAETGADAYLDISAVNYGYVAAGIGTSTPYRPFVYLNCKLVRASDSSVMMQDAIFYDPVAPFGQGKNVSISPDPAYTFVDFNTMESQPDQVVSGLDASVQQTTDAVGRLLR
ncbi:MAG: hypothetical protein JOZ72_14280 [Alphaproteobacteria bacterium]|nr:hypothetical protein [Alphaproteobacteria bacterium]